MTAAFGAAQAGASVQPISVMLVDDSAVVRGIISRGLANDPEIRVVGSAGDGKEALTLATSVKPEVVLLDVEMPVLGGLEALPLLLRSLPGVTVIMASALTKRHAGLSLRALEQGAADYVPKPDAADGEAGLARFFEELKLKIKAARRKPHAAPSRAAATRLVPGPGVKAVAIGASTGGPPVLLKIFSEARGMIKTPVFITQHMPPSFTETLAQQLGRAANAPACEPTDGQAVEPGTIYVAPGGWHMIAQRDGARIVLHRSDAPPEHYCRPSVNPMLRSLSAVYREGLSVAILTGMGSDGMEGCLAVADARGRFVVQDESTSVVWGMPGAAFRTGRAKGALPLAEMSAYLGLAMKGGL